MKILVTGAAGFIGSSLVEKLAVNSSIEVYAVDNNFRYSYDSLEKLNIPNVHLIREDVCNNEKMDEIFSKDIDLIVHLAALPGKRLCIEYPEAAFKSNIYGTYILLEESLRANTKLFIFASSYEVYGVPRYQPIDENHPVQANNIYSFTKATSENLIQMYNGQGLSSTILRLAPVYGYGLFTKWNEVIGKFIESAYNKNFIPLHKPLNLSKAGQQIIDLIHVKDVVDSITSIMENIDYTKNKVYNISNGAGTSIKEIAEIVKRKAKENISKEIRFQEILTNEDAIPKIIISNEKIKQEIGWSPKITVEEGIEDLLNRYIRIMKTRIRE